MFKYYLWYRNLQRDYNLIEDEYFNSVLWYVGVKTSGDAIKHLVMQ